MFIENYDVRRIEEIVELRGMGLKDYYISREGWIYSAKTNKFLNPFFNSAGYHRVSLACEDGERLVITVHKLVALAFLKKDEDVNDLLEIHHKNHIKIDNRAENLMYCTRKENMKFYHEYRQQQQSLLNEEMIVDE